jgi:cation transport ATPase
MTQALPTGHHRVRTGLWLSMLLGLLLLVFNTGFYFQAPLTRALGWRILDGPGFFAVWLASLLLCFLTFFLVGLFRGRILWNTSAATQLSMTTGLIGILPVIVVSVVIGVIGGGPDYFADGLTLAPLIGCSEILVNAGGAQVGRMIGSRFRCKQPEP